MQTFAKQETNSRNCALLVNTPASSKCHAHAISRWIFIWNLKYLGYRNISMNFVLPPDNKLYLHNLELTRNNDPIVFQSIAF